MENPVLESVIEMTGQKELDALECSLVITLAELVNADSVTLYKLVDPGCIDLVEALVSLTSTTAGGIQISCSWEADRRIVEADQHLKNCLTKKAPIEYPRQSEGSCLLMPIELGSTLYGVISVCGDTDWASYYSLISGFVRIYVNNLTILEESERDKLTGLLNRRTFDSKINKLLRQQNKKSKEYSQNNVEQRRTYKGDEAWLAMVDIDHFKKINDTFGHLYGDEVILTLSQIMKNTFRGSDLLFRFGGEEFVIVLEPTRKQEAYQVMERLRRAVADHEFSQIEQLTVSIGFTCISSNNYPPSVLDHADKALYYAKEHGRNCIYNYEDLVEQGKLVEQIKTGTVDLF